MRLDLYLAEHGYAESRERAKRLITEGKVQVNGKIVEKPALDVEEGIQVKLQEEKYVGRGAYKLEGALSFFGVSPKGLHCIDIGASTGGFTDCLLQNGAVSVTAVDAGCGQLHPKLLADPRVKNLEKYNARELSGELGSFDFAVMDVSFISQTYILPRMQTVLKKGGVLISLIKPQFEAGRAALNKNGIVKREEDRVFAVKRVTECALQCGIAPMGLMQSPIPGGDGNTEYLAYFKVGETPEFDFDSITKIVKGGAGR